MGFPGGSAGRESACNAGDPGSIPGSGRSPEEGIGYPLQYSWTSLVAQTVKLLSTMWETWVQSLGWEDPLEKEMAIHSSTIAWKIPCTEEPGRLQSMGSQSRTRLSDFSYVRTYAVWNSPGQNTGVGSLSLPQGIFRTQGPNPGSPHCRRILYQLSHKGSPSTLEQVAYPFSSGSSQPRNRTGVSCIAGGFCTS